MIAGDVHAFAEVETLRAMPLQAGIKIDLPAAACPRQIEQPLEQRRAMRLRPRGLVGYQVVDVYSLRVIL